MFGHSRAAFAHPPLPHPGQITTEPTWGRRRSGAWGGQRRRRCTSQKHDRSGWCFSDTMFGVKHCRHPAMTQKLAIRSSDKRICWTQYRAAFPSPPQPHPGQTTLEPTWGRRRSGAWGWQRRRRCTSQKHDRSGWCFSDTMFGSEALQAPSNEPETLSVAATSACLDTVGLPSLIHPYPIQGRLRQNPPGVGAGVGLGVGKGVGAAHHKSTTGQDGVSQTPCLA